MTMVGILILKLAYYEAALVVLLIFVTYFAKSSLRGSYEPAGLSLPLEISKVKRLTSALVLRHEIQNRSSLSVRMLSCLIIF